MVEAIKMLPRIEESFPEKGLFTKFNHVGQCVNKSMTVKTLGVILSPIIGSA